MSVISKVYVRNRKEYYREYNRFHRHLVDRRKYYKIYYMKKIKENLGHDYKHQKLKLKIISHYSNNYVSCSRCGNDDISVLSIHHLKGNGSIHRKLIGSGAKFYRWLIKNNYPEGYQVLCMNCQIEIEYELGRFGVCASSKYALKLKKDVIGYYSNGLMICKKCGNKNIYSLLIDHVKGGGTKHRKEVGGNFYRWLRKNKYPPRYQVLCMNCQAIKRIEDIEAAYKT